MISLSVNEQLFEAMKNRLPVIHKGTQYDRILDYIFWYDNSGTLRQSVVLLQNQSSVRVLADEVEFFASGVETGDIDLSTAD